MRRIIKVIASSWLFAGSGQWLVGAGDVGSARGAGAVDGRGVVDFKQYLTSPVGRVPLAVSGSVSHGELSSCVGVRSETVLRTFPRGA